MTPGVLSVPVRHRWIDEWMGAATPRLQRLVWEGIALVRQYEDQTALRKRQRRPVDQQRHIIATEVVIANLAYAVLMSPPTGCLAVLTGNGSSGFSRYDNPAFGKPLRNLIGTLEGIGWLDHTRGSRDAPGRGVASSIAPSSTLRTIVHEAGIALSDFGRIAGEELIIGTRKVFDGRGCLLGKELVDYPETRAAEAFRGAMRGINAFMTQADIAFLDDGLGTVDLTNRVQRRYFVCPDNDEPRFDLGGRLYGGAWQNLPKARRSRIRIEGEPITILDFNSMAPRLAYATVGASTPPGDIYALPGLDTPQHRPAVKKAFNTLLCDGFRRTHGWPEAEEGDPRLPSSWTVPRFRRAVLTRHPSLAPCLGTGMAHRLQNLESTILVQVLNEMKTRGIPTLSLHDGLLCPLSKGPGVKMVMEEAALDIVKVPLPVQLERMSPAL